MAGRITTRATYKTKQEAEDARESFLREWDNRGLNATAMVYYKATSGYYSTMMSKDKGN